MTPGAKSQPLEEVGRIFHHAMTSTIGCTDQKLTEGTHDLFKVRGVAWNRQVQHIMASTFASRCVVWDLRKNDPIIKVCFQSCLIMLLRYLLIVILTKM